MQQPTRPLALGYDADGFLPWLNDEEAVYAAGLSTGGCGATDIIGTLPSVALTPQQERDFQERTPSGGQVEMGQRKIAKNITAAYEAVIAGQLAEPANCHQGYRQTNTTLDPQCKRITMLQSVLGHYLTLVGNCWAASWNYFVSMRYALAL